MLKKDVNYIVRQVRARTSDLHINRIAFLHALERTLADIHMSSLTPFRMKYECISCQKKHERTLSYLESTRELYYLDPERTRSGDPVVKLNFNIKQAMADAEASQITTRLRKITVIDEKNNKKRKQKKS